MRSYLIKCIILIAYGLGTYCHADALNSLQVKRLLKKTAQLFEMGNCDAVIQNLNKVIGIQMEQEANYAETYKMLGVCYLKKGDKKNGEEYLKNLLFLQPTYVFDPFKTPQPVLEVVESIQKELNEKQKEIERAKQAIEESSRALSEPVIKVVEKTQFYRKTSPLEAFVPLGYPQFQQGFIMKGALIAAFEIASLGLNIGSYWWKRSLTESGLANTVSSESSLRRYNTAQGLQLGAIGVFVAIYLYGMIDALVSHKTFIEEK